MNWITGRYREDCKTIRVVRCCWRWIISKLLKLEGKVFFLPLCGKFSRGCNANIVDKYTIERISLLHFFLSFFFDFLPCLKLVFKLEIFNIVMKLVMLYRRGESCAFVWNCLKFCFIKSFINKEYIIYMYERIIISIIIK